VSSARDPHRATPSIQVHDRIDGTGSGLVGRARSRRARLTAERDRLRGRPV